MNKNLAGIVTLGGVTALLFATKGFAAYGYSVMMSRIGNRIFVIENGGAVESGRHDELLRKGGRYASFYRLQLELQEALAPMQAVANA